MSEGYSFHRDDSEQEHSGSLLDQLRADIAVPLPRDEITLHIPERPHISITYDTRLSWDMAKKIGSQVPDGDILTIAAMTCSAQCLKIERNGEVVMDDDGTKPVTFKSKAFIDATGAVTTTEALRKFFGRDADVIGHYQALTEAGGWNRQAKDKTPDPTV